MLLRAVVFQEKLQRLKKAARSKTGQESQKKAE
jgi:hypothetical protein